VTLSIDPSQPIPIYAQLKTILVADILRGRYSPGAQLPTEHELCAIYGISRTPVTHALSQLAEEGVVLRHRRRGTFVNPHWVQRNASARELRVVVPEGPWTALLRALVPSDIALNIVAVDLTELHQYLVHAVAAGQAPDLAVLDSVWVPEFAAAGFLRPLDELDPAWVAADYEHDFVDSLVQANRYAGRPVAAQAEADVAGMWFSRDALGSVGTDVPQTWDELASACLLLAKAGYSTPVVLPGGSRAGEAASYCLLALLASNGVAVLSSVAVTLDAPAARECLSFVRDLTSNGLLAPEVVGYDWDRPIRQLAQGHAGFCIGGSYEGPALATAAGIANDQLPERFGFARLPTGPSGPAVTLAGGMVHGIFRQAAHPELAMRALEELTSTASLAQMSRQTGQIPSRRSAIALVRPESDFLGQTSEMLDRAIVRPATPAYPRLSAQLQAMLESVLLGRVEPAEAVKNAAEMISAITGLPVQR